MGINLGNSLELNQSQKLVISMQLKQSLSILNMSRLEIEEEILRESEINPVLEVERQDEEIDWEKFLKNIEKSTPVDRNELAYNSDNDYDFENMVKSDTNFYDYLKVQASLYKFDKEEKDIVDYIINCLDEDGYLRIDQKYIMEELGLSKIDFEKYLGYIQKLDPAGVGARDLSECLLIQLENMGIKNDLICDIVREDLSLLGNNKIKEVAKKRGITVKNLVAIVNVIRTLEPRPGIGFSNEKSVFVEPDVIVDKVGDEYVVYLNESDRYHLNISSYYKGIMKNTDDSEAKQFIKEKLNSASSLIKNIENRKNTILKIAKAIVREQKEFFEKGEKYMKPMTMKEIANEVDFHESTISRGVNGKYILTPNGMYEFKYFFSSAIETDSDEMASSMSIKSHIKDIIGNENKKKPLSDDKIRKMLEEMGVNIARRTVAKYREELGILSSSRRKEY